jgi:hypothetical protein
MFIRGRERIAEVWHRFRLPQEGFTIDQRDGIFEARVVANADRAVDFFLSLAEHLPSAVNVAIDDVRSRRRWTASGISRAAVQDEVSRLRPELIAHAGLEFALFDDRDQLTLSRHLEVFVYARTDRWYYFLRALDLRQYRTLSHRSWRLTPDGFPAAPQLDSALRALIQRLELLES